MKHTTIHKQNNKQKRMNKINTKQTNKQTNKLNQTMSIWSENKSWQATDALLGTRPSHNEDGTIFPKRDIISCLHMARRWCFVENSTVNWNMNWNSNSHIQIVEAQCLNVSTIPLRRLGFWQCLPFSFSWTSLRGKICCHLHC